MLKDAEHVNGLEELVNVYEVNITEYAPSI